jgi:hypothetical protein
MPFRPFPAIPNRGRHIRERTLAAAAEFATGAVVATTAGEIDEAGANPAAILGFAAEPTAYDGGQDFNPGQRLVFVAEANSTFWISGGEDDDGTIVLAEPLQAHIGATFGLTKHAGTGIWYLDLDKDAANQRAIVEDIDPDRMLFEIRILDANRELN